MGSLDVDKADVNYEYPSEKDAKQYRKDHPMPKDANQDKGEDKPWKVKADKVRLTNSKGKYAQTGKKPNKPGTSLDPDHIEVEDVNAVVDNFEYDGDNLKVPVKHLSGKERSGLQVKDASGTVSKNKNGLDLDDVKLKTKGSDIKMDAHVDQDMLDGKPNGKASIDTDSKIDLNEVEKIVPDARKALKDLPHNKPVRLKAKARGNDKRLDIHSLDADVPGVGRIKGKGTIYNPTDMDRMKADLDTEVDLRDPSVLNKMLGLDDVKDRVHRPPGKHPVLRELFVGDRMEGVIECLEISAFVLHTALNEVKERCGKCLRIRIPGGSVVRRERIDRKGLVVGVLCRVDRLSCCRNGPVHAAVFRVHAVVHKEPVRAVRIGKKGRILQDPRRLREEPQDPAVQDDTLARVLIKNKVIGEIPVEPAVVRVPESLPERDDVTFELLFDFTSHRCLTHRLQRLPSSVSVCVTRLFALM